MLTVLGSMLFAFPTFLLWSTNVFHEGANQCNIDGLLVNVQYDLACITRF